MWNFWKIGSIPSGEAQPCNRNNRYCESNMCINSTEGYTCREFCSESSECSELNGVKQICQRIKLRDGTTMTDANKEVYGGVCIPTTGTPSLSNCETASCPNGETCILNPVNLQENPDRPWVFSVEYLCIENGNGAPNGTSCENDNECQSNLCSKLSSQCTVACTIDNQCLGIGAGGANKTCNLSSPANNDDDNPDNWILGGTCE